MSSPASFFLLDEIIWNLATPIHAESDESPEEFDFF